MQKMQIDTIELPSVQSIPLPPRTKGFPIVGALPWLVRQQLDFLEHARASLGDIYTLDLGLTQLVMLGHPDHAQYILRDAAKIYGKGGPLWDSVRTLLGNGLPVSEGDFWLRQRRMMSPQFHRTRLEKMTQYMVEAIDDGLAEWDQYAATGESFNLAAEMAKITMKVIVKTMFGTGISSDEAKKVTDALTYALDFMMLGMMTSSLPNWLPIPGRQRYDDTLQQIDDIVFGVIDRRRTEGDRSDDMISMLLDMVDAETGEQMTDQQLRDEAVTLFLAGYETTSVAMSWSFHYLTQQTEFMDRLRGETDQVLGDRVPAFMDVPQLNYARWIMQEALRLYTPTYWLSRTATEDDVIDGYQIRKGQIVAILAHMIHRHPDFWENPEAFDPERFSPENSAGRHQLAWIPFGAGQRQCIGRDFALMEGQLILSTIMQRYNVYAVPGKVASPHVSTTLRTKDGVWVTIAKR